MYRILVTDPLSNQGIEPLKGHHDVTVDVKTGLDQEELLTIIAGYDALLVRSQTQVTSEVFERADALKVVGRAGVGVDNIDLDAATNRGVIVVNAPDGNTMSTAEHAFAMMMAVARNIPQAYKSTTSGKWDRKTFRGVELNEKSLGIIGLGRIGTEVARRAKAFRMNVLAYDPFLTTERAKKLGIEKCEIDEVVANADFITVHTPLIKETHHLISYDQFQKMKDSTYVINCARGGIIDEKALYDAIVEKKVAGAALDVFESEPPENNPLLSLPEVVVTPHLGASTQEAQTNVAIDVCREVINVLQDEPFKNAVNLPNLPGDLMERLEPYVHLCEKMGRMAVQLSGGALEQIQITYSGELNHMETAPLTRNLLKGILSHHFGSQVNYVNVMHLTRLHDLSYSVEKSSHNRGFASLITVKLKTEEEERTLSGTLLNGYGARIIKMDDYSIDVAPEDYLLWIQHTDRPGMIGRVGSILGAGDVNIGTMQVGRKHIGGSAIMILSIDKSIPDHVLRELDRLDDIFSVKEIDLK